MGDLDCREIEERLPWFVSRTLSAAEQGEVEAHVGACPRCREALAATREAGRLYAAHLPAAAIVDYALGLEVQGIGRPVLELHLAHCEECREEQRLVETDRACSAPPETAQGPVAPPLAATSATVRRSRALALAASLAAVSALSVWLAMRERTPVPEGRVALAELLPESSRTRGAEGAGTAIDRGRATTLLLVTDRAETFDAVRVKIVAPPGGALLWEQSGLSPAAAGTFALLLPAGALPAGEVGIVLEGRSAAEWTEIARYRATLAP